MSDTPQHTPKRRTSFADRDRLAGGVLDGIALAGAGCIVSGVWEVYPPAGLIVAGLFLLGFALVTAWKNAS